MTDRGEEKVVVDENIAANTIIDVERTGEKFDETKGSQMMSPWRAALDYRYRSCIYGDDSVMSLEHKWYCMLLCDAEGQQYPIQIAPSTV